jgi:hypothetical protein
MKAYIEYLDYSPVTGELRNPCGDRSIVILDGRNNLQTWIADGHAFNGYRRPVYPHFRIMQGDLHHATEVYRTY